MKPAFRHRLALIAILLTGMALRLYRLGADSLWYDETVSVYLAGSPLPELIRHTAGDIHPPGYYLLLRGWLVLTGYPMGQADPRSMGLEFMAGFWSLCFGLLLVALVYALSRRVADTPTALIAAALVTLSPFNLWYSQEVRMYTLGAGLGIVATYALWRATTNRRIGESANQRISESRIRHLPSAIRHLPSAIGHRPSARWWAVYALAAAAGMYTLYYFVFLLIPLNLWALLSLTCRRPGNSSPPNQPALRRTDYGLRTTDYGLRHASFNLSSSLFPLLIANLAAVLFYVPWLPVAYHQAVNPPVPPWRTPPALWNALRESWAALSLGQSAPAWLWPVLVLTVALYGLGVFALKRISESANQRISESRIRHSLFAISYLPLATFGPLILILLSSTITPLYHVRYLFTYSPAFYVVLAAGLGWLWRKQRAVFAAAALAWLAAAAVTAHAYWTDPIYRPDDHRAAVRFLQERWRPGDVVLVNAGWTYTALATYWNGPTAIRARLTEPLPSPRTDAALVMVTTGHLNGDPNLGWGDPRSDFFALPAELARSQITALFERFTRVWQYRIYDTVNDPEGRIRAWLAAEGQLSEDQVFSGEANMRIQAFLPRRLRAAEPGWPYASFAPGLILRVGPLPSQVAAGETLYPVVDWQPTAALADFATSVRLVDAAGKKWAQGRDEPPAGARYPASRWPVGTFVRQTAALPIPLDIPPAAYGVELVVYDPTNGRPWPVQSADLALTPNGVRLGQVIVTSGR